jgi:hypothetical protein
MDGREVDSLSYLVLRTGSRISSRISPSCAAGRCKTVQHVARQCNTLQRSTSCCGRHPRSPPLRRITPELTPRPVRSSAQRTRSLVQTRKRRLRERHGAHEALAWRPHVERAALDGNERDAEPTGDLRGESVARRREQAHLHAHLRQQQDRTRLRISPAAHTWLRFEMAALSLRSVGTLAGRCQPLAG